MSAIIKSVCAREILDSRAVPTLECEVVLNTGERGVASVPSGASCGSHEALELRDNDTGRHLGKGVRSAVENVNNKIAPLLIGLSPLEQNEIDYSMIAYDATKNKSNLGANAILSVSEAIAVSAAKALDIPLYRYLGGHARPKKMPRPMLNILNGGAHAKNNIDIQEFMIVPDMKEGFSEALRRSTEVYHSLKQILNDQGLSAGIGDEGGFAPNLKHDTDALDLLSKAVEHAGYKPGDDFSFALDMAASEWYKDGEYVLPKSKKRYSADALREYIMSLCKKYPIISVEDGMSEDDIDGFAKLTEDAKASNIIIVGDDLFVTNTARIMYGVMKGAANAVLIKPNQIGTVTEAAEAIAVSKEAAYKTIMSHRSGETESAFIADFAVGMNTEFVKFGAPARSERTAKYNRLTCIELELYRKNII